MKAPMPLLKPLALPKEPVVAVVAPASNALDARLDAGAEALAARGWKLRWMQHARGRQAPYFSATAEQRLADLHAAFADSEIDAILCTRGGYGGNYLLPGIDLDLVRTNPKPLLGYSDLTALQTWLLDQTGLVSFHAPMLAADFYLSDGVDERSLRGVLGGELCTFGPADGLRVLRPGIAQGTLYGGCLTLLTASLGTLYAPAAEGKLLFIEDVDTKPYQVDRMLRQMKLAGKFEDVSGIVFGEMLGCQSPGARPELLEEAIVQALGDFAGPVGIGLRSGHVSRANVTLPFGVNARLELGENTASLAMLEPAVIPREELAGASFSSSK